VKIAGNPVPNRNASWFFDPTFFHVPAVVTALGQEGGFVGNLVFTGVYQNQKDLALFDTLEQTVAIYIPPANSIEIISGGDNFGGAFGGLTGQDPAAIEINLCEDDGLVSLDGLPKPASGVSTGVFAVAIPSVFGLGANGMDSIRTVFEGLTNNNDGSATLNTQEVTNTWGFGEFDLKYLFNVNVSGCNDTISKTIRIHPKPVAKFSFGQKCVGIPVQFSDLSGYDALDSVIVNSSPNGAIFPNIVSWAWDFDDENSGVGNPNTSTDQNPVHTFNVAQTYNVTLTITTEFGCEDVLTIPVVVGGNPVSTMTFDGVSENDTFNFSAGGSTITPNSVIDSVEWDFGDGNTLTSIDFTETVMHNYATFGLNDVTAIVYGNTTASDTLKSLIGCFTPITRQIVVLPNVPVTDANNYLEDFENDNGGWVTRAGANSTSSWAWGTPTTNKNVIFVDPNLNGNNIWITGLDGTYNPVEKSYVYSPAFDLSNLSRPMITFDNWVRLPSSDGVVLQFSTDGLNITDPNKQWTTGTGGTIGTTTSGINWYDLSAIAGKPGEQPTNDFGWSRLLVPSEANGWEESKHTLGQNEISGMAKVVFRFALGSANQTPANDGFAFDNVRIGNRTRIVLVENFSNTNSTASKTENDFLRGFQTGDTELVLVNYHTNFPGPDPFNQDNSADASARALFYNLSAVPRARLDGSIPSNPLDPLFSVWGPDEFSRRSLNLAKFTINTTIDATAGNELDISASLTALENIPANAVVHIVVVEDTVSIDDLGNRDALVTNGENKWEYLMKKMLPNAAGTKFTSAILNGETVTVNASWRLANIYNMTNPGLSVVVFAQSEDANTLGEREVYQASITPVAGNLVTSMEDKLSKDGISVYPNPADRSFTIGFKSPVTEELTIRVFDTFGKVMMTSIVPAGSTSINVDAQRLKNGMYVVQIDHEHLMITRQKIVVVH
jgi:PKD repeat protein